MIISLLLLLSLSLSRVAGQVPGDAQKLQHAVYKLGGLERMDTTEKHIYLTFTGGDYHDGGKWISRVLKKERLPAHFFFTGDFYRLPANKKLIKKLIKQGHYLGPH